MAMPKESAGLLLFRGIGSDVEVLLIHPGGPFWAKRDEGAWSLPKGEIAIGESPLAVAEREFEEELGHQPPRGAYLSLGSVRQAGGKTVQAWAVRGEFDVAQLKSNTFQMEWPPRSGHASTFPEVDRAAWFDPLTAQRMILSGQRLFIDRLLIALQRGAVPIEKTQ